MIKVEQRASTVLFKFLLSNCKGYHFLLPANVCPVVPLTFLKAKINFSFVDIDKNTHAGGVDSYIRQIKVIQTNKVGILYVNTYGCVHDTETLYKSLHAERQNLIIIEDNCLCVPETIRRSPKNFVDIELYSTGYSKFVQLESQGGYGIIRDELCYMDYKSYYNDQGYTQQQKEIVSCWKKDILFKYHENNWLPSLPFLNKDYTLESYLNNIRKEIVKSKNHKDKINEIYDRELPEAIKLGSEFNTWRYNLILPNINLRNEILETLFNEGLYASSHYKSVAYIFKGIRCINAEKESDLIINLFNEEKYTEQMAKRTADVICDLYSKSC